MPLKDILDSLLPSDDSERREKEETLKCLKAKYEENPEEVSDTELLNGISTSWDLNNMIRGGDIREDDNWLMEALAFTKLAMPTDFDEIRIAWERYLDKSGTSLSYSEYPIMETIFDWYYERSDDPSMAARAVSVYEYLFLSYEYLIKEQGVENFAKSYVPPLVRLWRQLKNYSRAKYLIRWMEDQYHARYLGHEDYLNLAKTWAEIVIEERGTDITECEKDLAKILKIAWDTISHRDRQIVLHSDEKLRLSEQLARAKDETYPDAARRRLVAKFGPIWDKLHPDTRSKLELGETYTLQPHSEHSPDVVPTAFFHAINRELSARVFEPYGRENPDLMRQLGEEPPISLLIDYKCKDKESRSLLERHAVGSALDKARCKPELTSYNAVKKLKFLRWHRNQSQHPEGRHPYNQARLEEFLREMWGGNWIINFLGQFHARS